MFHSDRALSSLLFNGSSCRLSFFYRFYFLAIKTLAASVRREVVLRSPPLVYFAVHIYCMLALLLKGYTDCQVTPSYIALLFVYACIFFCEYSLGNSPLFYDYRQIVNNPPCILLQ